MDLTVVLDLVQQRISTPIGELVLVTDLMGNLSAAEWADCLHRLPAYARQAPPGQAAGSVVAAVEAYFDGDFERVGAVPVAAPGTYFQRAVWNALRSIPAGTTVSYGALARSLARPGASRAVGHANGANPVSVVVPCHRLVGTAGLTGYGGGLHRKAWLLAHERRHAGS